ncbi:MAG TPA: hypothetical protein VM513_01240 [Kofleriaceae bacterium]|nr:hypothetical protein [Kofleriaceae bacterium]
MRKLALVLALAACGDKKANDTPAPGPESPKVAREQPPLPSDPTPDDPRPDEDTPTPTEAAPADADAQTEAPAAGGGTCEVTATAGREFKQTSGGGPSAANVMQWHTPEMRKKMGYQAEGFVLNCNGQHIKLSIVSDRKAAIPYGSKDYQVGQSNSHIRVMGTMGNVAISKASGMLAVDKFDDKRLEGRLTLYINGTSPPTDMFKLVADFNFTCSGLSGCK